MRVVQVAGEIGKGEKAVILSHWQWTLLRRYPEVRNFHRDFDRGQQAVIGTEWGLPGIPGQPLTYQEKLVEAKASKERIMMMLKAQAEKNGNAALFS